MSACAWLSSVVAVIFHIKPWANAPFCPFNDPRLSAKKWRSFDHCHLVVRQIYDPSNLGETSKDLDQLRPFIATGILNKKQGKKRGWNLHFLGTPIQAKIIFEFLSNSYFSETFLVNFKRWGMGKQNSNGSLHFNSWTCSFRETSKDLGPPSLHFSIILNLSSEGINLEGLAPIKSSLQLLNLGELKRT